MYLRLLIIGSLLLSAIGLGTISWQMLSPPDAPAQQAQAPAAAPPPSRISIVVAARPLLPGTLLKDEDFATREVPPDKVPDGAIAPGDESRLELRGALLRRYLDAEVPLAREDVLRPRDRGFLAAVLRPGSRAISVGVDVVTGAAGLIWPGDQVDLILTQELAANDAPLARRVIGETVLTDVRVIAVDQQFARGANPADTTTGRIARTVTLEVTAEQAERVAVAGRLGRIALTVRSMEPAVAEPPLELAASSMQPPRDTFGGVSSGTPVQAMPMPGAPMSGAPMSGGPVFGADVSPALARSAVSVGARMRVIQGDEQAEIVFR